MQEKRSRAALTYSVSLMPPGSSRHPEWILMYCKGLTARRIAELCGVVEGTVTSCLRAARASNPDLVHDHQRNVPEKKPTSVWFERFKALRWFHEQNGRFPSPKSKDAEDRRLARWLTDQRAQRKADRLSQEKLAWLGSLPGWQAPQRSRMDTERWERRLAELKAYRCEHDRWPRRRNSDSEHERVLGVWLHTRRQEASRNEMSKGRRTALDAAVPGWNTWKTKNQELSRK